MKAVIGRGFFLSFLFTGIAAVYIYFLLELPLEESWFAFYELQFADVPLGWWILNTTLLLGWSIAIWTGSIGRSKEKAIEQRLTDLIDTEKEFKPGKSSRPAWTVQSIPYPLSLVRSGKVYNESLTNVQRRRTGSSKNGLYKNGNGLLVSYMTPFPSNCSLRRCYYPPLQRVTKMTETQKPLLQVERMVQQAQLEMRALLLHLRPAALNNKSLAEGLEELLVELREKVLFDIRFRLEEVTLSKGAEDHLFRIAQETLSNTLRHAQATEVDVLFVERDGLAILRVQDNGVGFKDSDGKGGSYGLQNVKERAIEIGGTCKIVSVPSQGTIVEVKLPARKGEELNDQDSVSG